MNIKVNGKNENEVMLSLKKYGIAIIPSFVTGYQLEQLREEFLKSLDYSGNGFTSRHKHPTNEDGMVVRVKREELNENDFPAIKKIV